MIRVEQRRVGRIPWLLIVGLATCLLLFAAATTAAGSAPQSVTANYTPPPERYVAWTKASQYVAVRDGTRLAIDVYRPAEGGIPTAEQLPVVLVATPYLRSAMGLPGPGPISRTRASNGWLEAILRRGYVIAVLDVRGHGASFGSVYAGGLWGGGESKRNDLYDVVEWLAVQPWSTGKIGMAGCSYVGLTQFWAADAMPPHLKAIVPCGGSYFDEYGGLRFNGVARLSALAGIDKKWYASDILNPSPPVDEDKDGALREAAIRAHRRTWDSGLAGMEDWYLRRPFRDSPSPNSDPGYRPDMAQDWNFIPNYAASGIAVFQTNGWRDILVDYSFKRYRNLAAQRAPQRMIIGPWWHCQFYESDLIDTAAEHIRWFDYWLKGVPNGVMEEPPIRYYLTGARAGTEWRTAQRWPLPGERRTTFFLGAITNSSPQQEQLLTQRRPSAPVGHDEYRVDYTASTATLPTRWHARPSADASVFPVQMDQIDAHSLHYTTGSLSEDTELTGHPLVRLWVSSSARDQDFFVFLEDVDKQGRSTLITEGMIRASYRATRRPPFDNGGLPWHSGLIADHMPLTPGVPAKLEFALFPAAHLVRKGHRIRVTINSYDTGYDTPRNDPAEVVRIYRDAQRSSSIELPVIAKSVR